ncbi:2-dehydro-3-deoxyphosphogluconate aldolase / (4S)-4-hydroxy-2-oxoglutarate aldolase [Pedobacter antarcticus]|nr:2-dehydro-3-deoxyphosphogluconate aldolase / (4S)-4-hydroxy-2-oxoglutarate aldolase [Pedobacter antarcticus]
MQQALGLPTFTIQFFLMKKNKEAILATLKQQGLLPLYYLESQEESAAILQAMYNAGVRIVEYTNRGHAALKNFSYLSGLAKREMPDLHLGIGTIKTPQDAEAFINAGADFIVSPIVSAEVASVVNAAGLLWVPGCMTPTEIHLAQQNEAMLIKLFPANVLGTGFMSAIKELFPGQLFIPTGGVDTTQENITSWFQAGVCAVGMGSKLITKEITANKNYSLLEQQTKVLLELIGNCR